jgi:DNA polymerase elongation subunit (family B)
MVKGLLDPQIMQEINSGLVQKKQLIIEEQWYTCTQKTGILAQIEQQLREEKRQFKHQCDIYGEKGRKLTANGIYGMFQDDNFEYRDQRIGLVITAVGRIWIRELSKKSKEYGIEAIHGDTDSIFGKGSKDKLKEFQDYVQGKYGATLELDKEWSVLLIKAAKSYFGITKDGRFHYKKIAGMKSNNTQLQKELMSKVVNKDILQLYANNREQARMKLIDDIKFVFNKAQDAAIEENKHSFKATKDYYEDNGYQREVCLELDHPMVVGRRYDYWKIKPIEVDGRKKKFTMYPEKYELDTDKVKQGLINCIDKILIAYGIDISSFTILR